LADYDGDGLADLLSGCDCCEHAFGFYLFRRQKDGSFAARQRIELDFPKDKFDRGTEFPDTGLRARVAVTDWNCDGIPDLLVGGNTHVLGVVYGPLASKKALTVERVWPKGKEPVGMMSTNLCVADWDGDRLADLVVGGEVGGKRGVYWLRNVGTKREPRLAEPKPLILDENFFRLRTGVCVTDWNADGRPDLIASRQHQVWVYLRQPQ